MTCRKYNQLWITSDNNNMRKVKNANIAQNILKNEIRNLRNDLKLLEKWKLRMPFIFKN